MITLADRSMGHALAPLAFLYANQATGSIEGMCLFFEHFLIARQLNNDTHDWETDLWAVRIKAVAVRLIQLYNEQNPVQKVGFEELLKSLAALLWQTEIGNLSTLINEHCDKAEAALKKCPEITDVTFYKNLLQPIRFSSAKALEESQRTKEFIQRFNS